MSSMERSNSLLSVPDNDCDNNDNTNNNDESVITQEKSISSSEIEQKMNKKIKPFHNYGILLQYFTRDLLVFLYNNINPNVCSHEPLPIEDREKLFKYGLLMDDVLSFWPNRYRSLLNNCIDLAKSSIINTRQYKWNDTDQSIRNLTQSNNNNSNSSGEYTFSVKQEEFINTVKSIFSSEIFRPGTCQHITLTGDAGCGKTFTIHGIKKIEPRIKILFISLTNTLNENIEWNYGIKTHTLCKFLMKTLGKDMSIIEKFTNLLSYIGGDLFKSENCPEIDIKIIPEINTSDDYVIFFDEISRHTVGMISFFIYLWKRIALMKSARILIIFSGDFNQIPPFYLSSKDYKFLFDTAIQNFQFDTQTRITDEIYEIFLKKLLKLKRNEELIEEFKNEFNDKINPEINYEYPFETVDGIIQNAQNNIHILREEFLKNNIQDIILEIILLTFTNTDAHYNNLSIALKIYNQTIEYQKNKNNLIIEDFIQFIPIYTEDNMIINSSPLSINNDKRIHVLPLIRFFPYKLLTYQHELPISTTTLYLLAWNQNQCWMLDIKTKKIKILSNEMIFRQNLFGETDLEGFPIQLAYANTFHSSHELALQKKLCINMINADKREIYYALSRIRNNSYIENILL